MKTIFRAMAFAVLASFCLFFTSCIIEHHEIPLETRDPWGIPPFSGTVSATANGYYENSVTVTITLANGVFTNVVINVMGDTAGFREMAHAAATPIVNATNSFHIPQADIDGATGATLTLRGIVRAGSQALLEIPGVYEEDLDWRFDWEWVAPPDEDMG